MKRIMVGCVLLFHLQKDNCFLYFLLASTKKNKIYKTIKKSTELTINQVEEFIKLNHAVNLMYPLPNIGEWATSADFLLYLYKLIMEKNRAYFKVEQQNVYECYWLCTAEDSERKI